VASISTDGSGNRRIMFIDGAGKRHTIRVGKLPMKQAERLKLRVEALNASRAYGQPLDNETLRWLSEVNTDLARKLAAAGLVGPRSQEQALDAFLAAYIDGRTDVKPRTRKNLLRSRRHLADFFGADRPLREVTPGDADAFAARLRTDYAPPTAARAVRHAGQFFKHALRKGLIDHNPFADVRAGSQENQARLYFVTRDVTTLVLDACPDAESRAIIALCRYGGLRCPSEVLKLRWGDVDWEKGRFLVRSPKTEHTRNGGLRWVPLFPELRSHLEPLWDAAPEGEEKVISRRCRLVVNPHNHFRRIILRAGLLPWPRLFQNLRASRETELTAQFPLHVVTAWIGNSAAVAARHYLQVTDEHFAQAAHFPAQSAAATGGHEWTGGQGEGEECPGILGVSPHAPPCHNV